MENQDSPGTFYRLLKVMTRKRPQAEILSYLFAGFLGLLERGPNGQAESLLYQ